MKLILASSGFNAPESVKKCEEFVGKPASEINFAVINEAMAVEHGDHKWFLDDMDSIRNNFGGNIEFVNLRANDMEKIEERLAFTDVIFVAGGNTDYLMTAFEETGFDKLLPKLLNSKVYVGSSAGSCVLGRRPGYKVFEEIYQENQYTNKYLELVDFTVLPHLHSIHFNTRNNDWVIEESKRDDSLVYAISDDASVVVDNQEVYVVGKGYLAARKGVIEESK